MFAISIVSLGDPYFKKYYFSIKVWQCLGNTDIKLETAVSEESYFVDDGSFTFHLGGVPVYIVFAF